jgi:integrase
MDAGVPIKTVSGRLGHAHPATSLNVYAHFIPASDRVAADVMGDLLTALPSTDDRPEPSSG